jgi:magnesium transporter
VNIEPVTAPSSNPTVKLPELAAACGVQAVRLDFEQRREVAVPFDQVPGLLNDNHFVWLELSLSDPVAARQLLTALHVVTPAAIEAVLEADVPNTYARYEHHLHLVLSVFPNPNQLEVERVDVLLGERFLVTLYRKPVALFVALRKEYHADFVQFAKTPSFLLYEIWDHLLQNYLAVQKQLEERVEGLQLCLKGEHVEVGVFAQISDLGSDLSRLRRVTLPARTVLADLVARRSLFVSETTQGALANLVGTVEHILGDLTTDHDLLSEAVNLYMSSVSFRTNEVMKRLTVVSVVFLPLTFIVGVYGMNFEHLPELRWEYGYVYFWVLAISIVAGLLTLLRRARFW